MSKKKEKEPKEEEMVPKQDYDDLVNQLQRLQAEFDNFRKRNEEEKAQFSNFAQSKVILDLLPVLDNFELALSSNSSGDDLKKGVEMIYAQFIDTLEKIGVKKIESVKKDFDPNLHEALMSEKKDDVKENTITEELQKGYTFNGRVIRCSKVKIAK